MVDVSMSGDLYPELVETDLPEEVKAWCNLCLADGREFGLDAHDPSWMKTMQEHTARHHPEHLRDLLDGKGYEPVAIQSPAGWNLEA